MINNIYIDITRLVTNRLNTGIQRVVKEFLLRALYDGKLKIYAICYNSRTEKFMQIESKQVKLFLQDTKYYQIKFNKNFDLFDCKIKNKIFFDIDAVWNTDLNRKRLYKKLKLNGFQIYNFIYDLIPILYPKYMHKTSKKNFPKYIKAIYKYGDKVFFDSNCAQKDFFKIQKKYDIRKKIETKVIYLGSDISTQNNECHPEKKTEKLFNSKYILFVGTIEPRKKQELLLDVFDTLYKMNKDLNLVFIGKIGWKVELFINKLYNHPLKDQNIYHFTNVDDETLKIFYKNAFLVTYLSEYEGYGLPIAESLQFGNITLASKNSSMLEVGDKYVDYVKNNSKNKLKKMIEKYINNSQIYLDKKKIIQKDYKLITWDSFYCTIQGDLVSI